MIELYHVTDIEILMEWRCEVIRCVFGNVLNNRILSANREYFLRHVPDGSHMAFLAVKKGIELGCGAVCIYDEMPSPDNETGRCGYIMNIYVRPEYRHKGVATAIIRRLLTVAKERRCGKIYLETTDMGRAVYRDIGFKEMKDMMKYED